MSMLRLLVPLAVAALVLSGGASGEPGFTVVMSNLDNPRGLDWGSDGGLYVVEAGRGGDGPCIVLGEGEQCYGTTGAISRLLDGRQERVVTGLPSLAAQPEGNGATGLHDVVLRGQGPPDSLCLLAAPLCQTWGVVGWGGDPRRREELDGLGEQFAQLLEIHEDGTWTPVADLGAYEAAVNPDGGPVDSNPYGVIARPGWRIVAESGGNAVLRIDNAGQISTLAVLPSRPTGRDTDSVPTAVTTPPRRPNRYFVGELTGFPFPVGGARVYRVEAGEKPRVYLRGFTGIIDLDFGPDGSLYVLQHATEPFLSGPGELVRIAPDGAREVIAREGLVAPTSVLVGRDGVIYVSNFGVLAGIGEVIRIDP